ncbi:MAG: hypothetical protein WCK98_07900 [bacterium]
MSTFETLTFPKMMGNLASDLAKVQRVVAKKDNVRIKEYLWESLTLSEIIKQKYPNKETTRLFEVLANMWLTQDTTSLDALSKYSLDFYINSLS